MFDYVFKYLIFLKQILKKNLKICVLKDMLLVIDFNFNLKDEINV